MSAPPAEAAPASAVRTGVLAAVAAYTMWGFFPLYFIALREVAASELLLERIVFAVPFGALIVLWRRQGAEVWRGLTSPRVLGVLTLSALFIAGSWLLYIVAVQSGRIFEASLGYYINPLIYVLVGVVVLGERLRRGQALAVGIAAVGVTILTFYGGSFPWISFVLAISFTVYGYLRKVVTIGAMPGLFIETLLLLPFALVWLTVMVRSGEAAIAGADPALFAALAFAGPATVLPLLCFAIGARRLTLATLGFLQFIGPSIQFLVGLWDGEAFTPAHAACFACIWTAAGVFAWDAWRAAHPAAPRSAAEA